MQCRPDPCHIRGWAGSGPGRGPGVGGPWEPDTRTIDVSYNLNWRASHVRARDQYNLLASGPRSDKRKLSRFQHQQQSFLSTAESSSDTDHGM